MRTRLSFILGGLFLLGQAATGWASTAFTVSATVPSATGISIGVDSVNSTSNVFTALANGTTALNFDPMTFNTTSNIYVPSIYYALNFGVTGGAGTPDVTVTYNEGTNPNGSTNGLGYKATATFAKEVVTGTTTAETITSLGKMRLIDLNGTHEPYTAIAGGYLRIYLGIWTGSTVTPADPTNGQPFTTGDASGQYTGSLVVTAVVN
jgi:hypothetical protein